MVWYLDRAVMVENFCSRAMRREAGRKLRLALLMGAVCLAVSLLDKQKDQTWALFTVAFTLLVFTIFLARALFVYLCPSRTRFSRDVWRTVSAGAYPSLAAALRDIDRDFKDNGRYDGELIYGQRWVYCGGRILLLCDLLGYHSYMSGRVRKLALISADKKYRKVPDGDSAALYASLARAFPDLLHRFEHRFSNWRRVEY